MKCHENASDESRAVPCGQKTSKSWQPLFDAALRTRLNFGVWYALQKQYKNRLILKGKRLLVWICSSKLFHGGRHVLTMWSVFVIYLQPGDTVSWEFLLSWLHEILKLFSIRYSYFERKLEPPTTVQQQINLGSWKAENEFLCVTIVSLKILTKARTVKFYVYYHLKFYFVVLMSALFDIPNTLLSVSRSLFKITEPSSISLRIYRVRSYSCGTTRRTYCSRST